MVHKMKLVISTKALHLNPLWNIFGFKLIMFNINLQNSNINTYLY